jgi:radical SAM superfamily enzyme
MKSEYELQLAIAEVVGILMKTHPSMVNEVVGEL